MNADRLRETLAKIPILPLVMLYLGYMAYDYYDFQSSPASPLNEKVARVNELKTETAALERKVQEVKEFYRTLEAKKATVRGLAQQLQDAKATISDQLDVAAFMKMVVVEAARVGIRVKGLQPDQGRSQEFYSEQPYSLEFHCVFPQFLAFLQRLASLETIIRVDNLEVQRTGSSVAQYVELGGKLQLKTFRYLRSQADEKVTELAKAVGAGVGANAPSGGSP